MASKATPSRSDLRLRQRRRRIISLAALVLVVGTAPWWSQELSHVLARRVMGWNDHFRVNHVTVTGLKILPPDTVLTLAKIPVRHLMLGLDFGDIEKRIHRNPWVKEIHARRRLPDTIELQVTERVPVAAVRGDRMMVLTADSMAINPASENWVWDLPILSPPRSVKLESGARIKDGAVLALLRQTTIARSVSPDIWKNISEMYYSQNEIHAVLNSPHAELIAGKGVSELAWIGLQTYLTQNTWDETGPAMTVDLRLPGKLVVSQDVKETAEHKAG